MLYREIIALCSEIHTKYINVLCGQNVEFVDVKPGGLRAGRSGDRIPPGGVGARFSAAVQTGPGAHPTSCKMGTGYFPGVNYGRGVTLTTHPILPPRSWKSRAITLSTLWATTGPVSGLLYFS